ncbi:hypothetical protein [Bacilliculturomica massiliensis]|nr:hypothetical protein [Bacilliculturomica massiliensis]
MSKDPSICPAHISDDCEKALCCMEAELSDHANKEIILVAYEKTK